jgi:hypothetical protein
MVLLLQLLQHGVLKKLSVGRNVSTELEFRYKPLDDEADQCFHDEKRKLVVMVHVRPLDALDQREDLVRFLGVLLAILLRGVRLDQLLHQ